MTDFILISHMGFYKAEPQTEVRAVYDDKNLYVQFKGFGTEKSVKELWTEIFLDPAFDRFTYRQFMTGGDGYKAYIDYSDGCVWKDTAFDVAFKMTEGGWCAEYRIPFALINAEPPKPGTKWTGNFCRASQGVSSWSGVLVRFHEPHQFGELIFE
jgi:hypothetical protein